MRAVFLISIILCCLVSIHTFSHFFQNATLWPSWSGVTATVEEDSVILFTGDIFLGRAVERDWARQEPLFPFRGLQSLFTQYEYVCINFESAIPEVHRPTPDFGFQFSVSKNVIPTLETVGVTHVSLANNHSFDFTSAGYQHTFDIFSKSSIQPIGEPYSIGSSTISTIKHDNDTIAIIALNAVYQMPDQTQLKLLLAEARSQHDIVIVYIHWGTEYKLYPDLNQKDLTDVFVESDVDIVVGHHPHVRQSISRIGDTLILYSLGNTIFDQYFSYEVQQGLLVGLEQVNNNYRIVLHPIESTSRRHQPQVVQQKERSRSLSELAAISDLSLQEDIKNGYILLP